jgi:hypothetical protein
MDEQNLTIRCLCVHAYNLLNMSLAVCTTAGPGPPHLRQ